MPPNIDAKFEGEMTCAFKNGMKNLASFHQNMFESLKIWTLMGSFYLKQKMYELEVYKEVLCNNNEE